MPDKFAQVAVALPINKLFHYSIPEELAGSLGIGKRVRIPFQTRTEIGYVVGLADRSDFLEVKPVSEVIDKEPILNDEMLSLTKWIAESYFCSWGEAIASTIPSGLKKGKIEIKERKKKISPESTPIPIVQSKPFILTEEQKEALDAIGESIDRDEFKVFLLHGITASGKTEVYMQAIDWILKKKRGAIVLVPEISLTPQTMERFISRFGERVAVIHSALTSGKRFAEWKRIKEGKADIAIGARSAIFSPVKNLGLVIVDEEHETSYKQDDV